MRKLGIVAIALICITFGLPLVGIGGALLLENQDSFCAACHTEPETTYYDQSIKPSPVTLAAYHTQQKINCIDCHNGAGTFGRLSGLQQGAHDLLAFLSGTYRHPAITTNPLGDPACVKCHEHITNESSTGKNVVMNGHYHTYLPLWKTTDSQSALCGACHAAHIKGLEGLAFMSQGKVGTVCENCHTALGGKISR